MSEPFLGQIKPWACNFPPRGWAICAGQILAISTNQALFSVLGKYYGGDGINTFALPDLRGRTPVHVGNNIALGTAGGEEAHPLTINEIPAHTHAVSGSTNPPTRFVATGSQWATDAKKPFSTATPDTNLGPAAIGTTGTSQAHNNMQPYLPLNFCIALQGIYPTRN